MSAESPEIHEKAEGEQLSYGGASPSSDDAAERDMKARVQAGYILESPDEMTPGYRKALITQLMVQGDTELMSAPAYWGAAQDAPSANTQVSAMAIIQDELAHANIAYRILEDMGLSKDELVYGRQPHEFKHPYGFDQPLESWAELVTANGFFDRAGGRKPPLNASIVRERQAQVRPRQCGALEGFFAVRVLGRRRDRGGDRVGPLPASPTPTGWQNPCRHPHSAGSHRHRTRRRQATEGRGRDL